jgi:hypothetical protein
LFYRFLFVFSVISIFILSSLKLDAQITGNLETPEKHFGFKPGTDYMLFDYEELIAYLQKLTISPRFKLVEIGKSPMGRKMYIAFVSSEKNIQNLENLKMINKKLALDPLIPDNEKSSILENGKVFFLATLSMHSGEVAPAQALPLIIYKFLTTTEPEILKWLDDVVYMAVPNHNPDGMDMIVNHYKKYKGTKYDGSSMPGVYHKYVGHDNNRDFITLTQEDTKAIAWIYNQEWFPQVFVEKHQMGSNGPRYYVPPSNDPIAENIDAGIWTWSGLFGSNMMKDLTAKGLTGVVQRYVFDDYWPGSTETCIWKNVIGFLTEGASPNYASPIYVEPTELSAGGKGLGEYKIGTNMPLPWPGGWWKLGDLIEYEIGSTLSIIKTASINRKDILQFRNDLCKKEVMNGQTKPPYYYIMSSEQHDESEFVNLVNLLKEHGVQVYRLTSSVTIEDKLFKQGDIVVPLSQPFRPFIKEVMEKQFYPVRHFTPGGEVIKPYDIASWSLPLHMGVKSIELNSRSTKLESSLEEMKDPLILIKKSPDNFWAAVFNVNNNESFKAAFRAINLGLKVERLEKNIKVNESDIPKGSFLIYNDNDKIKTLLKELKVSPAFIPQPIKFESSILKIPRIAFVETYFHDMDAGWTRYIFDTYNIPYTIIRPGDFEKTDFINNYDIVIFPDNDKSLLMQGKYKGEGEQYIITNYPPEYTKGIGKEGMDKILYFLDKGGIIISWGRSTNLFIGSLEYKIDKDKKEEFQLPVRDISEQLQKAGLYCPGSLLKILLTEDSPLTLGMGNELGVFSRGRPVFTTSQPIFDMDRRVIGKYPERDILLSGYCENEEKIGNKAAIVWIKKGKGQLVLFGFNPQFRASTNVTFKLLFNSILLPKIK